MSKTKTNKGKILIVEDQGVISLDVKNLMAKLGYSVVGVATSAKEAMALAKKKKPDLVLMDIIIKGKMDGIEAAKKIKADYGIPSVFLTAYVDQEKVARAKAAQPFGYILKPFRNEELKAVIEMALFRGLAEARAKALDVERTKMNDELEKLSQRQKSILATVPDIIMEVDKQMVYTWANQAGFDFFGKDVIGKEANHYFEGEQNTYAAVRPVFTGKEETIYVESWQRRKDGEKRLLAWWCKTLKDGKGKVIGALSSARDITEHRRAEEALQDSKNFLDKIINTMSDPVFVKDDQCRFVLVNDAEVRLTGLSLEKQIGKTTLESYPKAQADIFLKNDRAVLKTGKENTSEEHLTDQSGKTLTIVTKKTRYVDAAGNKFLVGVIRDITEREKAEETLRESEERLQHVVNVTQEGIWEWDMITNHEYFAPRWCEIIGYSFDDKKFPHTFQSWASRIHPDDYDRVMGAMKSHLEKGTEYNVDYRHRHKSGEYRWQNSRGKRVLDKNGKPIKMVGCITDITERKKAEELLQSERNFANNLVETAQTIILLLDTAGRIIRFNPYFERLSGYRLNEVKGKSWFTTFLPPRDRNKTKAIFKKAVGNIQTRGNVNPIIAKDGHQIFVEWYDKTLKDKDGKVIGLLTTGIDITERKKAEKEIKMLSSVVERSVDGMAVAGLDGNFIFINEAWAKMHGNKSAKELLGKSLAISHNKEQLENDVKPFNEKVLKLGAYSGEVGHMTKDGKLFPTLMTTILLKDEQGKPYALGTIAKDITEYKKAEEKLRTSEEKYRALTESASDQIFMVDKNHRYLSGNKSFANQFGLSPEKMIGKSIHDFFPKKVATRLTANIDFVLKTGHSKPNFEEPIEVSGRKMYINTSLNPIKDSKGRVVAVAGISRDITRQKVEEEQLLKLKFGFERSLQIMFMTDIQGKIQYANPSFEKIYGYKEEEVIGKTPRILKSGKQPSSFYRNFWKQLLDKKPFNAEIINKNKKGDLLNIRISVNPILDPSGQILGFLAIHTDITEQKKTQAALQASQLEIESMVENSPGMIYRALPDWSTQIVGSFVEKLTGYPKKEFEQKKVSWFNLIHPADRKRIEEESAPLREKAGRAEQTYRIVKKNGDVVWVKDTKKFVFKDGHLSFIDGIVLDITESKKIEAALLESEMRNRTLVNALPACIKMFDSKGQLLSVNSHGREEHGLQHMTDAQIRNWDYLACIKKEDHEKVKKGLDDALKGKPSTFLIHHTHIHAQGGTCFSNLVPIVLGGKIKNVLFTSIDVTKEQEDSKELQKKVEQMEFVGRTNLKRHKKMLEMEARIKELEEELARLKK